MFVFAPQLFGLCAPNCVEWTDTGEERVKEDFGVSNGCFFLLKSVKVVLSQQKNCECFFRIKIFLFEEKGTFFDI